MRYIIASLYYQCLSFVSRVNRHKNFAYGMHMFDMQMYFNALLNQHPKLISYDEMCTHSFNITFSIGNRDIIKWIMI